VAANAGRIVVTEDRIRILIAKPGLDGHDRGAQIVARGLRDAGMEVIYTGIRQTPEMIVYAALQEDVDCIGLSALSGALVEYASSVVALLHEYGESEMKVIVGGIVAPGDKDLLFQVGVAAVFGPGSAISDIVDKIREQSKKTRDTVYATRALERD
jgi:methylmalonyl-CoA mutase C-terminal domain/subunit